MEIIRIGYEQRELVIPLFDQYRTFYRQPPDPALAAAYISARLKAGESVIFAAMNGGETAAGFTQLYPNYSSVRAVRNWVLNDLYVVPAWRGKGVGRQLIDTAAAFAKEQAAVHLQLETGVENVIAQKLYEDMGFVRQRPAADFYLYRLTL